MRTDGPVGSVKTRIWRRPATVAVYASCVPSGDHDGCDSAAFGVVGQPPLPAPVRVGEPEIAGAHERDQGAVGRVRGIAAGVDQTPPRSVGCHRDDRPAALDEHARVARLGRPDRRGGRERGDHLEAAAAAATRIARTMRRTASEESFPGGSSTTNGVVPGKRWLSHVTALPP